MVTMAPGAGPAMKQSLPPAHRVMVIDQDYHRVNRGYRLPDAASASLVSVCTREQANLTAQLLHRLAVFRRLLSVRGAAVPLHPFRPGAAHVVQLRPIAVHETEPDAPNESQDVHSPNSPDTSPWHCYSRRVW